MINLIILLKNYKLPYLVASSAVGTIPIINSLTEYVENLIKNDSLILYSVALFVVYSLALIKLEVQEYEA